MKAVAAALAVAMLACGCAYKNRPSAGPGSGQGADYVPYVERTAQDADKYEAAYAKCQRWAAGVPFQYTAHKDALFITDAVALGAYAAMPIGPLVGVYINGAGALGGALYGFGYWVGTPERQATYRTQETIMMNCMAREGFPNLDPTVKVTWVKPDTSVGARATGRDTFTAERFAKSQRCRGDLPVATLVEKGPGYENHAVACGTTTLAVRCEFGQCRETEPFVAKN